jgi:hypothetical protein
MKDSTYIIVMFLWLNTVIAAFILGVYLVYQNERTVNSYQERQLQYLEDIKNAVE